MKAILDQRAGEGRSRLTVLLWISAQRHIGAATGPAKPARFVTQMPQPRNRPGRRRDAHNSNGLGDGHQLAQRRNIADVPGCAQDGWHGAKGDGNAKHSR